MESRTAAVPEHAPIAWTVWLATSLGALAAAWLLVAWTPDVCPVRLSPYLLAKLLLISPVLEEAAFRGGVLTLLLTRLPRSVGVFGISAANAITSVLFAATHVFFGSWVNAIAFVPSLVLGLVYERCGKLWPVILLHAAFNAALLTACTLR